VAVDGFNVCFPAELVRAALVRAVLVRATVPLLRDTVPGMND